ncbi:dUTP diphosphatase [Buchnera aphidicola]|uniref:dUTP diphosphatase n=1 Tax=Buchnera aphidicola TaxID=9 RepID=UPI0034640C2C
MNNVIDVKILDNRLGSQFEFVKYQTEGSSALDLRAMIKKNFFLNAQSITLIPSGISIFIKNPLITAMILPRSGLGHYNGIILGNSIGLIDSDYQGELMISVWNRSMNSFLITPGDRIAQLVFIPIIKPHLNVVSDFQKTIRNEKGFGHSGKQ